jgi:hypothetical protein
MSPVGAQWKRTKLFVLPLASAFAVSDAFAKGTAFADDTSEAKAACEALKDAAQDGTEEEGGWRGGQAGM